MTLQRVYLYLVSAAALVLLAIGLAVLGATILQFAFRDPKVDSNRVAVSTPIGIVALTVWSVHFWLAQRLAHRNPYERNEAAYAARFGQVRGSGTTPSSHRRSD